MRRDWVVLDYSKTPHAFVCKRCGAEQEIQLPASIDKVITASVKFSEQHAECPENTSGAAFPRRSAFSA